MEGIFYMSKSKIKYYLIYVLCAVMPFHSMVIDKVIGAHTTGIVNLWRDLIVVTLVLLKKNIYLGRLQKISCLFIVWILLNAILSVAEGESTVYLIFNMARIYIVPVLLFIAASSLTLAKEQLAKIIKLMWQQGIILTIFGIFQMFVLGSTFLTNLGYGSNGQLNYTYYISGFYGFQRMVSTFSSANDCGLYLACLFVVSVLGRQYINSRHNGTYIIGTAIIYVGIILTFSRTALISATVTVILYYIRTKNHKVNLKRVLLYTSLMALVFIIAFSADKMYLNGRVMKMVQSSFTSTVRKTDASFVKHLEDLYLPIFNLIEHPFGYSFGTNGPVALSVLGRNNTHLVESSIWLIGYESGIVGVVLYYTPIVCFAVKMFFEKKKKLNGNISAAISLCVLLAFMTLPYCASFEMPFLMFLFMGLSFGYKNRLSRNEDMIL